MPTESEALQLLQELGLTEYEARCLVALSRISTATATQVSELSEVPRSRVYDSLQRLHERGLVDVQQSEPRIYRALDPADAVDLLRDQYDDLLDDVGEALDQLHRVETAEEAGAWAIADADHVADRIATHVEDGEEEVYVLITDAEFSKRSFPRLLADAADRGLDVVVEVSDDDLRDRIAEAVPEATVVETDLAADPASVMEKWLGGMVMVDREAVLIGAMGKSARPDTPDESAIWASGTNHGLVVGMRHLLTERIDDVSGA